ncbi:MAG: 50S ribosomal protein L29 [Candidatus Curtissbacteria bacterium]|nr:50S ribosomal protein L29 [Candidatus Curtissbacteria bacterium]
MKKKDLEEFKKQDIGQLKKKIADLKKEAANIKIDLSMGKVKNVHSILQKKKAVAKIMTILTLKTLAAKSAQVIKTNKEVKVGAR